MRRKESGVGPARGGYCLVALLLVLSVYTNPLWAGEVITAISISGLKRTKLGVAEKPLKKFLGQEVDSLEVHEVHAAIMDTGILEPLSVEIADLLDGEGKALIIVVREKWAIFPLPVVFVGSGGMSVGGFFIDTNALGLNDKFFAGGMYLGAGWMAGGGYMHTAIREGFPGWRVSGFFSQEERHDTDQRDHDIRRFNLDSITGSLGISYPFMEVLNGSLRFSYQEKILRDRDDPVEAPESGARTLGIGAEFGVRKRHWDGYLLSQESASLGYTYQVGINSPAFHTFEAQGIYEKSLIPGFRLNLRTGMVYSPGVPPLFESSPAAAQVAILPGSFSAQHYAGASLGIEKYLFKLPFGTLSALASYQLVYSHGPLLGDAFDHGVAGALSFYMSKLAIPALGLGIAYNLAARYVQGSFSLGMSF
ncbi:MAG: hypothetical protein LBT14_01695 [Treponema sp.]|jgi:hypothetical protein|nr:hypothetical protein [Treponema sp.]